MVHSPSSDAGATVMRGPAMAPGVNATAVHATAVTQAAPIDRDVRCTFIMFRLERDGTIIAPLREQRYAIGARGWAVPLNCLSPANRAHRSARVARSIA